MSKGRILVVEDENDIANLLHIFFTNRGYEVSTASTGQSAFARTRSQLPDLIVLDIMLPDTNGFEICQRLRTTTRTSHIPIIFLTQRDERSDIIAGLELGADDYITKPFDMEELGLRVRNALNAHRRRNMTDPRTGLPSARIIEDQLRTLVKVKGWTYIEIHIDNLIPFRDAYGYMAADEVLRYTARLLNEIMHDFGSERDFVGQAGDQTFVLITFAQNDTILVNELQQRFDENSDKHYSFSDVEQGGIRLQNGQLAPMIRLSYGTVTGEMNSFSDIREITRAASVSRQLV